jgi:hypothetical protein
MVLVEEYFKNNNQPANNEDISRIKVAVVVDNLEYKGE